MKSYTPFFGGEVLQLTMGIPILYNHPQKNGILGYRSQISLHHPLQLLICSSCRKKIQGASSPYSAAASGRTSHLWRGARKKNTPPKTRMTMENSNHLKKYLLFKCQFWQGQMAETPPVLAKKAENIRNESYKHTAICISVKNVHVFFSSGKIRLQQIHSEEGIDRKNQHRPPAH